ncbi:MAG: gap, partial [Burkholderiales bacterium]|nr:gap [Burkholderiales bacterium]
MTIKVAINGYGRIGRCILRALYEGNHNNKIEIVAINDLGIDLETQALLTQHDSVHGYFSQKVEKTADGISINGHEIKFFAQRNPSLLPWANLGVDVV